MLLDKIYKFEDKTYELGGVAAAQVLDRKGAYAVHTTCYEQKTKVTGLKAANAFWNPHYYDPRRRTITKPIVWQSEAQVRAEVRALLYLGVVTNRSIIVPNVLGDEQLGDVELFEGRAMWPGFRIAFLKPGMFHVDMLEPAFYWRVARDYLSDYVSPDGGPEQVPRPTVVTVPGGQVRAAEELLQSEEYRDSSRVVLDVVPQQQVQQSAMRRDKNSMALPADTLDSDRIERLVRWADDSVGLFDAYEAESQRYEPLQALNFIKGKPTSALQTGVADTIVHEVRLCAHILGGDRGNRSCFDKCD